ncbi:hypothetical protein LIER_28598 [Lithospermum erythrorhizon]|uniref:Uncharacterized protein n=1 Tax=Lithospermum erythrorhizon TaxID=34254 RepID=A0AAV3RHT7_LITER
MLFGADWVWWWVVDESLVGVVGGTVGMGLVGDCGLWGYIWRWGWPGGGGRGRRGCEGCGGGGGASRAEEEREGGWGCRRGWGRT